MEENFEALLEIKDKYADERRTKYRKGFRKQKGYKKI